MNAPTEPLEVYYFGCRQDDIGHHWHWHINESNVGLLRGPHNIPDPFDGVYAPYEGVGLVETDTPSPHLHLKPAPQGHAHLTFRRGWSILAYWDQSADSRPGSNSAFVARGQFDFETLLKAAKEQWAWVFERQPFEVVKFDISQMEYPILGIKQCEFCGDTIDRVAPLMLQCRGCGSIGDTNTGFMIPPRGNDE